MSSRAEPPTPDGQRTWTASLAREMRRGLPLYLGLGAFFSLVFGDPLGRTLFFALCIGPLSQLMIRQGQFAIARMLLRRGERGPALVSHHWPGWAWMGPWVLLSVLVSYLVGANLAAWILGLPMRAIPGNPRLVVVAITICALAVAILMMAISHRARLAMVQAQAEAAQRAAAETQLKLLQSQLEPHMLFNTLANLRVLVGSDPARAQAMLDRLIAFLRSTLTASRSATHPLADEFARIDDYLALMQVRMGPRLAVSLELPAELAALPVPPLLLQPLVENAIKHGLEPKVAGGRITVRAVREGDRLRLQVLDDGVGAAAATASGSESTGFGLTQVRERLAATFGDRARLDLQPAEGGHGMQVTVSLPIDAIPQNRPTA